MEDYILKEIDKIGKIIEAILIKLGVLSKNGEDTSVYGVAQVELLERLDIDIDLFLSDENLERYR